MSARPGTRPRRPERAGPAAGSRAPGRDRTAGFRPAGNGRQAVGVVWAVALIGLWLWGGGAGEGLAGTGPTTGDIAAVGRPLDIELPPAHDPIAPAGPRWIQIPSLGVDAPVEARGLDAAGAIDPPPFERARTVGWFGSGTRPGAAGAALLVGHVDTETRPAVFYGLSAARPGEKIRITRTDDTIAEFTIDDVQVHPREGFDPGKVYGAREPHRAELRLITCGGTFDRAAGVYTANVVVSAYLTATED
ncbi:class F sortase [Streptomyces sp. CBMA370]|uniref:class F sortase n=1 Tax=Streptomyces sp. CBMA370 TaxID=1930278 RepID=UPI001661CA46|nr:class F sortase [Streptomyces sp. CBMA370]